MTMTPALGALAQASDALARAAADPQSGAEAAVATTIDLTLLILGPIVGAFVGIVVSVILSALARKVLSKAATASSILARVRRPGHFTFAAWGAWAGLGIALVNPHLSDWNGTSITTFLMHMLLIVALACLTWMAYAAAWVFEDAAKARQDSDQGRSRRFETQAQVLRRLTQSIVVVVGAVAIIGTFEAARHAMTTVLASAGVISVIFGLAAQQTLGNVFAGLQLAFTDAIRVGDVVVAGEKKETGSVEEITLSYVVVRIWDERRLIIPCRYFTQTPFENWTRRVAAQLGTVELKLDWSAPMTLIRAKVEQLLTATDLWDGRTWGVQITDSDEYTVTVRVLVSAKNSGYLSDLRAYMREQLISWIVTEEPWARPAQRIEPRQTVTVEQDMSRERIARLAAELAGISGTNEAVAATGTSASHAGTSASAGEQSAAATGGAASAISASGAAAAAPKDPAHAARMVAARRKAKRARRRAMADRQRELAEGDPSASRDETQVISKSALRKIIEAAGNANPQLTQTLTATSIGRGERFFSGSAEAEARAAALEGPGEEAFAEREAEARRAQERRESHKRRETETLDPEATEALAAVGVEPVEADQPTAPAEPAAPAEPTQEERSEAQPADAAPEARVDTPVSDAPAEMSVSDEGDVEQGETADGTTDAPAAGATPEVSPDVPAADATPEVSPDAPASDEEDAPVAGDAAEVAAADEQPTADAEPEGEDCARPAEAAQPTEVSVPTDGDAPEDPQASSNDEELDSTESAEDAQQAELASEDEQATTPIPARETSVKQPVQVPPPARTGRPVMTDTVQAVAPALAPPPAPTPAEMAASREDTPDEPTVHPGWYAVAEEARLDAETRPTAKAEPAARVSIMDFFPAVAPTGAEADVLRAVTGQIPAVGRVETGTDSTPTTDDAKEKAEASVEFSDADTNDAEKETSEESATPADTSDKQAPAEAAAEQAEGGPEQADAAQAQTAQDAEATAVMTPVETAEALTAEAEATQVLPTLEEPPALDETLVMPTATTAEDATTAAPDGADEDKPAKAPAKKAASKKAPAKKAATKKTQTAKKGSKKAASTAKAAVTEDEKKATDPAASKDEKTPTKKAAAKKATTKKGTTKKASTKKATAKKTSTAKSATEK